MLALCVGVAALFATACTAQVNVAASATLNTPYAAVSDVRGNIYIADTGTNSAKLLNASTGMISVLSAFTSLITTPKGIAVYPDGSLIFVGSTSRRRGIYYYAVYLITSPTILGADNGNGKILFCNATANRSLATVVYTGGAGTTGLAFDIFFANLYTADQTANTVTRISLSGFIATVIISGLGNPRNAVPDCLGAAYACVSCSWCYVLHSYLQSHPSM